MMDPYTYYHPKDFQPKSFVMVRNSPDEPWQLSIFAYAIDTEECGRMYVCLNGAVWKECINYTYGHQKGLLGTTEFLNENEIESELKKGQPVAVRNSLDEKWRVRRWLYSTDMHFMCGRIIHGRIKHVCSRTYPLKDTILSSSINFFCKKDYRTEEWKYCLPLNLAFNTYDEMAASFFSGL